MPGPNDEKRPVSDVEKEEMKDRRRPVSVVTNAILVGRVSVGLEKEEGAKQPVEQGRRRPDTG